MLDLTRPVQTRSGNPVQLLATDLTGDWPLLGIVTYPNGKRLGFQWKTSGQLYTGYVDKDDLVNAPAPARTVYLNIYTTSITPSVHRTVERANYSALDSLLYQIALTYNEDGSVLSVAKVEP